MKTTSEKLIPYQTFPDYLASDETKATKEYGLAYARAIQREWFYRPHEGTCAFYDKRELYDTLRRYARGEQDMGIYKKLLNNGETTSYTNYDWRPIQILPKFVKLIVNQMSERLFEVRADAVDKFSTDMKNNYREYLESLMVTQDLRKQAKDLLGVDLAPTGVTEIPETQEEIDIHMALKYKPAIEIATEEAIRYTFNLNDFEETQNKVIEDVTVIGVAAVKHDTDPTKGIVIESKDPADMVYHRPTKSNFGNVHYFGEVERMTVMDLQRLSGDTFTKEELLSMAKGSSQWASYHRSTNQFYDNINEDNFEGVMVDVMHFTFKSLNTLTYKKKYNRTGGYKMTRKESTFDKKSGYDGYDVVKKRIDVWYEGSMVLGTDKLFNYKLAENMIRPEGLLNITMPKYVMYAPDLYQGRTRGVVEGVVSTIDQMQQIHIKIQQLIAKARPNGIYIDATGLNEVALGDGSFLTPLEAIKIYDDTGNMIGTSVNAEGEYNFGKEPIKELKNGGVAGLADLLNSWNHYMNKLRDDIGIPVGADASMPHPDTAVGVQEQVALNSNTATRHILNSALNVTERVAKGVMLRMKDIFKYSELREVYINAIGKINVGILDSFKNFGLHDLGINISLKPDAEEKRNLELNINNALSKAEISLDDAIDIREIGNLKLANQLLKIRRAKKEKDNKQFEMDKIKATADANAAAAERAAQAKLSEYGAKSEAETAVENAKSANKIKELEAEAALKRELMAQEFEYNMKLKGMEVEGQRSKMELDNKFKTQRQDRNNTQASKNIEQRNYNAPANNFESNIDSLNGSMDLGDIGAS